MDSNQLTNKMFELQEAIGQLRDANLELMTAMATFDERIDKVKLDLKYLEIKLNQSFRVAEDGRYLP